jgi:two-component system, OmpR family, sensor kinase
MSLRRRLIVALSVVGLVVVGSIAAVLLILRASQHDQLDKQLSATMRELLARSPSSATGRLPDTAAGAGGAIEPSSGQLPKLAPDVAEEHATDRSAPFKPFSVGHYRVAAVKATPGRIVVAAVSTDQIDATFRRVVIGSAVVGAVLLAATALAAWWVERLGLRPIRNVAAAAQAIASGEVTRRVEAQREGTEAGDLARSFNVMVDQRQAVEEQLRRFVADASHELRTPLTTVGGVLELVQAGSLAGPELDEAVRRARSETRRMTILVEDLLMLTQLDQARPLAGDDVDLAVIVKDAVVDVGVVQPQRPVTADVPERALVRADETRLRQVVANLVNNAVVHTPTYAALHLAVYRGEDVWVLDVRDDGPGLTSEQAARVFDRFYRVASGRSRRDGGTGLGLSIVQSVVAALGGQVSVTAAPGEGCCFRVVLPTDFERTSRLSSDDGEDGLTRSSHDEDAHSQLDR